MNAQQFNLTNEEKNSIWIPRPYYYFTLPQIRMLWKKELSLNKARIKKFMADYDRNPKLTSVYKPSRLFFIYEQMLCLSIPTKGKLRYTNQVPYTPYLLANVLEGDFESDDIEEAIQIFEKELFLITIESDLTITMNLFDDSFPGKKSEKNNDDADEENNRFTEKVISTGYIAKDSKEIQKFNEFFNKVIPTLDDLTTKEIMQIIFNINKDSKNSKATIQDKFKYFEKSFRKAIETLRENKKQASFAENCDLEKKEWI